MASSATFDDASVKFDVGSWTAAQLRAAANLTLPSPRDLLLAGPRMGMKIGSFFLAIPEAVDDVLGGRLGQRVISEATGMGETEAITTAPVIAQQMAQAGTDMLVDVDQGGGIASKLSMESVRSFGNIFSYATSKWALCCVVMAIVLNRTHIYASTRRNLTLGWKVRFALRVTPVALFIIQVRWMLQSIQCQTSPDFGELRWNNASRSSDLMFTQNGGPLHTISSTLLLGATDAESCRAVSMVPPEQESEGEAPADLSGSLSLLWPLFETLCFSQFVETISCAVQGRQVAAETGMTLFEHSLAFAEADAAVSSSLGWGPFGGTYSVSDRQHNSSSTVESKIAEIAIKRSMIMRRINTPPEVLLVGALSSMNHITSHILGIFNLQGRLRLVSTGLWGLCFMAIITWSILNFSVEDLTKQGLLRFPTVCIIGFIPHVLVLAGIILCSIIYGIALVLSAFALAPRQDQTGQQSFMQKLMFAHDNMQANVPLSNIRISMHMDFYQALLKTGFNALTMASEAVYLQESSEVNIKPRTWLENDRLREIEDTGAHWLGPAFRASVIDSNFDDMADGVGLVPSEHPVDDGRQVFTGGYARERTAQKRGKIKAEKIIRDGVGATERSGRWIMAFEFFIGIAKLIISWTATIVLKAFARAGLRWRPRLLVWLVRRKAPPHLPLRREDTDPHTLDFWIIDSNGELVLPADEHVDVEVEMRKRLRGSRDHWSDADEQTLESNLYAWWINGGWWGGDDSSGAFSPLESEDDFDTTSVVSMASEASASGDWQSDDDGRRTPTQQSSDMDRESTPLFDSPLATADLAQLLHPRTPEQRAEAQALAAHLASNTILTRSRYKDLYQRERAKVVTSTRYRPDDLQTQNSKLTPEDETAILEYLITSRRANRNSEAPSSWADGASGMGDGGPQCVVCQSCPRSIIVWPCRCLSLCDDCRVTLAMNNFDKCVCCRRDVGSFSRIFVP